MKHIKFNLSDDDKKTLKDAAIKIAIALGTMIATAIGAITLTSCNVTRVVKTEAQYFQRGDTTCTIVTKTTETYDATKK